MNDFDGSRVSTFGGQPTIRAAFRSTELILLFLGLSVFGCFGNAARTIPKSQPAAASDPDKELDVGHISVHATVARAVPFGTDRLNLEQLLEAAKIFALVQQSKLSDRQQSSLSSVSAGLAVGSPIVQSIDEKATTSSTNSVTQATTTAGATNSSTATDTAGNETTSSSKAPTIPTAPAASLALAASSPTGLVASPYELFYATAETILAARSLETLYNVADGPDGWALFSIPVVASFEPGRVTRSNYIGEAVITFDKLDAPKDKKDDVVEELRLVAVAPAGLSSFASSSLGELSRLQSSIGAGAPIGSVAAQLQAGGVKEALDTFSSMARRPDLQVAIASQNTLVVRYLGRETFQRGIALNAVSFNMEVLALIKIKPREVTEAKTPPEVPSFKTAIQASSPDLLALDKFEKYTLRLPSLFQPTQSESSGGLANIQLVTSARYKPAFQPITLTAAASATNKAEPYKAGSVPDYGVLKKGGGTEDIVVYTQPKSTRIDGGQYYPDGQIVLSGGFQKTCTCLAVFVDDVLAGKDICQTPAKDAISISFKGIHPSLLTPPSPPAKKRVVGRVSLLKGTCSSGSISLTPVFLAVSSLAIQAASPQPEPEKKAGKASFKSVDGVLDDLGATFYIEYVGDASDPTILVDGLPVPLTRLERVMETDPKKPKGIIGGKAWIRASGGHDPRLREKVYFVSIGAGGETKETKTVVAKR